MSNWFLNLGLCQSIVNCGTSDSRFYWRDAWIKALTHVLLDCQRKEMNGLGWNFNAERVALLYIFCLLLLLFSFSWEERRRCLINVLQRPEKNYIYYVFTLSQLVGCITHSQATSAVFVLPLILPPPPPPTHILMLCLNSLFPSILPALTLIK